MLFQAGAVLAAAGLVAGSRCKPHSSFTSSSSSSTSSSSTSSSTSISSSSTIGWENVYTATASASVAAAAATAKTSSPTSKVKGKVFDRYVSIWFENTDYAKAIADREYPVTTSWRE
jgi:acid phosphatase